MERTLQIQSPYGKGMTIKTLQGNEGISQLYEFKLILTSKDPNLGNNGIGQPLTTSIDTEQTTRYLSGIITDFGYLHEDPDELDYHLYTCTVRPNLWYLSQRIDSRVFVDKTVLDIAATLLGELGINYQNNCQNGYRTYGHSTQYQETSLDYLNRLFEQEGIYYYFEHSAGNHTLILADNNAQHKPILGKTTLPYHSKYIAAGTPDQAYIDTWQHTDHLNTKQVSVNDYNYQMAKTKLTASGSTHSLGGQSTEQYDFYTNFKNPGQADHYKTVRTEDHKAHSQSITASGNVLTIAPGYTFSLERHPHQAANSEYLITQAHYDFQEAGYTTGQDLSHYRIDFTAIPKSHQYRAPRHTPKPRMLGTQAAIVTGPAGEEVYTNEYGDIKVQFHWDRYGPMNEKSSDWIRVIQGSAGGSFGSINTPRIGEEVLVDFINGDSDRPIVVGRLYNSSNPPPWGFPAAAKKSGIKSKSFNSPLSNFNELMFDDTASSEMVNFQAQKDLTSLIKHDETRTVNHDRTTTIDNDETVMVHGFRTETVDKDETITIHQNRTETVDKNETITIHENRKERVDKDETISIGGNRTETVEKNEKIDVLGNRTETVGKNETLTINKSRTLNIHKNQHITINGLQNETIKLASMQTIGLGHIQNIGATYVLSVGVAHIVNIGMTQKTNVGQSISMHAGKTVVIEAGETLVLKAGKSTLTMDSDGNIELNGNKIHIAGDTVVDIDSKLIDLN
ncbi:type VI secretion system tip protein VgrG (plasmid) [Moraxella osloensis]|uniref:Type VI secretion system tip protein VgrG n=1 Tax=Faucicola osloensis TaxID=34062 RepID=A0A6P1KF53_FAUOS|nr:type VI secretion system tip protein TssI/VgrG [Moraxella osloensis]QHG10799.1 type VI secretion system tip protein VgrG [Moraxella osloensis]